MNQAWRPPMPDDMRESLINLWNARPRDRAACAAFLSAAQLAGWKLQELADVVGVTRECIRQITVLPFDLAQMPKGLPIKPTAPSQLPKMPPRYAINRAKFPVAILDQIRELHALASQANGATPIGDPRRLAGDELASLLAKVTKEYGVSYYWLGKSIGLSVATLRLFAARRGLAHLSPSQSPYQNRQIELAQRKSECSFGHPYTPENTYLLNGDPSVRQCRTCNRRRASEYQSRKKSA